MFFENEQLKQQDNDPRQKHKDRNPVDPMHIPHPLRVRRIRVPLLDIKILLDLSPNSHDVIYHKFLYLQPIREPGAWDLHTHPDPWAKQGN
jgi:hypothetical protein